MMFCGPPDALADCQTDCSADGTDVSSMLPYLIDTGSSFVNTGSSLVGTGSSLAGVAPRTMARFIVPPSEYPSFDQIITHESGWNVFAVNPTSGAYGLGQALPPQKMSSHGFDWLWDPLTQIRWAYDYMCQRYGSPDSAWAFWQVHHWY
ncbi:transglycosylase SLT domain-containing protein [Nocardia alni]|uniref:aggregation-promoting factor C-terminal-like domain-containing protein n=1 Tax=Nocardia alni TaxID=2815723 RepID=UPI0020B33C39|nr:transglycosylase SLT domain-containing protein [Nocardia alni]